MIEIDNGDNSDFINSIIRKYIKNKTHKEPTNKSFLIEIDDQKYTFTRLRDDQYYILARKCIPIPTDYDHLFFLSCNGDTIFSHPAKLYAVLRDIFGESGRDYDPDKGSFSFPFLISFVKEEQHEYIMNIRSVKGGVEFPLGKVGYEKSEWKKDDLSGPPFEDFSREEITDFIDYLIGYFSSTFQDYYEKHYNEPFFGVIRTQFLVFGYKDGEFFEDDFDNDEDYHEAVRSLKRKDIPMINTG